MTTHVVPSPSWAAIAAGWRELAAQLALYALECERDGLGREAVLAERRALAYLDEAAVCELGLRLVEREPVPA